MNRWFLLYGARTMNTYSPEDWLTHFEEVGEKLGIEQKVIETNFEYFISGSLGHPQHHGPNKSPTDLVRT